MHINPQDEIDMEDFKHSVSPGTEKTILGDPSPPGRPIERDPRERALRSIRRKCSEIRARRAETGPDPWQEAVALYLASPPMAGKTPRERAGEQRLLHQACRVLEASGLPANPGALGRADLLYLHAIRHPASGRDRRQMLASLGRFLEFWQRYSEK